MIKASPLTDKTKEQFYKLFEDYYKELDCADDTAHLLDEYILPDLLAGLISIDILHDGNAYVGFVIYQIDDITNDWNLKEGCGDIREIYIAPEARKKGYGKFLLYAAELKLFESGAKSVYCLPYESAVPFFVHCGYSDSQEYNEDLDCFIYDKELSLHKCSCEGK
ncbi:MAG: GNAT family N-acetyltransferase [Clostridia bacterium]|nr:GNAT family N-acetyltransferase [Clostridia bacterium]